MSHHCKVLSIVLLTACAVAGDKIPPDLIASNFTFDVVRQGEADVPPLAFSLAGGNAASANSCVEIAGIGAKRIAEVDYFRFRVARAECKAIEWFAAAKPYRQSAFDVPLSHSTVREFPALILPLLSEQHERSLEGKSIAAALGASLTVVSVSTGTIRLSTVTDEVYLTVLGRGDFNHDEIEDLLIKSEWFARDAFGKHVDLVLVNGQRSNRNHPILLRQN